MFFRPGREMRLRIGTIANRSRRNLPVRFFFWRVDLFLRRLRFTFWIQNSVISFTNFDIIFTKFFTKMFIIFPYFDTTITNFVIRFRNTKSCSNSNLLFAIDGLEKVQKLREKCEEGVPHLVRNDELLPIYKEGRSEQIQVQTFFRPRNSFYVFKSKSLSNVSFLHQ